MNTRSPGSIGQIPDRDEELVLPPLRGINSPTRAEEETHRTPRSARPIPGQDERWRQSPEAMRIDPVGPVDRLMPFLQEDTYRDTSSATSSDGPAGLGPMPMPMRQHGDGLPRPWLSTGPEDAFATVRPSSAWSSSMPTSGGLVYPNHFSEAQQRQLQQQQGRSSESLPPIHSVRTGGRGSPSRFGSSRQAPYPNPVSPRRQLTSHTSATPLQPAFDLPHYYSEAGPSSLPDRFEQSTSRHSGYYQHEPRDQAGDTSGISVFGHPEYTSVIPSASRKRLSGKSNTPAACFACKKAHLACDTARPCKRCVGNGRPEECVDVPHKKRGRPKLTTTASAGPTGGQPGLAASALPAPPARADRYGRDHPYHHADTWPTDHRGYVPVQQFPGPVPEYNHAGSSRVSDDPRHRRIAQEKGLGVSLYQAEECPRVTGQLNLEAVVTIRNDLTLTGIIPFNGNEHTFGERGSVLDKQCISYPFLDFIHPDDRDKVRDAVFCALVTRGQLEIARQRERERLRANREHVPDHADVVVDLDQIESSATVPPVMPIAVNTEEEMTAYLSQDEQHRGIAIVRLKTVTGTYPPYQMVVRNDPKQWFMGGKNDLVIGLERASARNGSVSTPSQSSTPYSAQDSVGSLAGSSSIPSLSPSVTAGLPSFSELAAKVQDPYMFASGSLVPPPMASLGPQSPGAGFSKSYDLQQMSISTPTYNAERDRRQMISPIAAAVYRNTDTASTVGTPDGTRPEQPSYFPNRRSDAP